jgi:hypothetical protein
VINSHNSTHIGDVAMMRESDEYLVSSSCLAIRCSNPLFLPDERALWGVGQRNGESYAESDNLTTVCRDDELLK